MHETYLQKFGSRRPCPHRGNWGRSRKTIEMGAQKIQHSAMMKRRSSDFYLAGVELDESLFPKMVLYCGGPPGGAASKHFTQTITPGLHKGLMKDQELLLS